MVLGSSPVAGSQEVAEMPSYYSIQRMTQRKRNHGGTLSNPAALSK